MAVVKRAPTKAKSKKVPISRAEAAQQKAELICELNAVYNKVKIFCTGRPPRRDCKG